MDVDEEEGCHGLGVSGMKIYVLKYGGNVSKRAKVPQPTDKGGEGVALNLLFNWMPK